MNKNVEDILNSARRYRACNALEQITDIKSAIDVLLTPQGREFAVNTSYPSLDAFRVNMDALAGINSVLVDAGRVLTHNHDIVAVGDTAVTVKASGPRALYHVMAMHGAKARVEARNFAVVTITSVGGTIEYDNDGTAVIAIERK